MTDSEFTKLFEPYGSIVQSNLLRDKNTGLSRGVGFIRLVGILLLSFAML
jgi:RNA recognition motif-containing protein